MKITLLQEWVNGDRTFKPEKYQILDVPDDAAKQLIEDGIAEEYKPVVGDVKILRETEEKENIDEKIGKTIDEKLAALTDGKKKPPFAQGDENYEKNAEYDEFWQFARDIYQAGPDNRNASEKLLKWNKHCKTTGVMAESEGASGLFLIPEEMRAGLMQNLIEASLIRGKATVVPMSTNRIKVPTVVDTSHTASTHGGIVLYRPGEEGQKDPSKPKIGQVQLNLHKLIGLMYATDELMEDSPISIAPLITRMFTEAFSWQEDEDFINGTGSGMPLGILRAPCLVTVAKQDGQDADTIYTENIINMWSRLRPEAQRNAVWIANSDCFPMLATLSVSKGTGGSVVGLLQYNTTGIAGAPAMSLMGRPLSLTEHCQTVGTKGDIYVADWRQYLIGQKAGASAVQTATSIHLKFDYDETAFRFVMRYDGQPWEKSPLTPKHSLLTLSSFVSLNDRD